MMLIAKQRKDSWAFGSVVWRPRRRLEPGRGWSKNQGWFRMDNTDIPTSAHNLPSTERVDARVPTRHSQTDDATDALPTARSTSGPVRAVAVAAAPAAVAKGGGGVVREGRRDPSRAETTSRSRGGSLIESLRDPASSR